MAINCSVASEEDLANYHDFLEKVGKFIYLSSSFSRNSEDTRAMTSFLYSHPHVKKHYRPRFENYNEDIKSLLSATYKNRALFMRESLGSTLFLEKVEQAMFKVDTSLTDGLLNETNRIELEPKEHLTPERIGQIMKERELSGREGESKLDEMMDQWRVSQAYNNSQASSTNSSQSHGIQGKGLSNVNLLKRKNLNTGSGQSSGNQQVGNGHGQQQNTSSSNSNSPLGGSVGTGKSSSIRTVNKKLLNSTNSKPSTANNPSSLINDLGKFVQSIKNPPAYYTQFLETYYKNVATISRDTIRTDMVSSRLPVNSVANAVDLMLSFVNVYAAKNIRDKNEIDAFSNRLDAQLQSVQSYRTALNLGGLRPNFSEIISELYDSTGVHPTGYIGTAQRLVIFTDYEKTMANRSDRLAMTLGSGKLAEGELYKRSMPSSNVSGSNSTHPSNSTNTKASVSGGNKVAGRSVGQQSNVSNVVVTSGFGEKEILNILQNANSLPANQRAHFDKNLKSYYVNSTSVARAELTNDLLTNMILINDSYELVDLMLTYVNIYSSRGIRDAKDISNFAKELTLVQTKIVSSQVSKVNQGPTPNFEVILQEMFNFTLGTPGGTKQLAKPIAFKDYAAIIRQQNSTADMLRGAGNSVISGNIYN